MKLFADHCFFASAVAFLKEAGYDIITAREAGLSNAPDEEIVPFCLRQQRITLTLDRDFQSLFRFPLGRHKGIVVFRINPFAPASLMSLIQAIHKKDLFPSFEDALVIVSKNRIKIIKAGKST